MADGPADAFPVANSPRYLLLCTQGGDLGLEAFLNVIRQPPPHAVLHLVLDREEFEGLTQEGDDFGFVVGRAAGEEFDAYSDELPVAALLRAVIAVAALDVEEVD